MLCFCLFLLFFACYLRLVFALVRVLLPPFLWWFEGLGCAFGVGVCVPPAPPTACHCFHVFFYYVVRRCFQLFCKSWQDRQACLTLSRHASVGTYDEYHDQTAPPRHTAVTKVCFRHLKQHVRCDAARRCCGRCRRGCRCRCCRCYRCCCCCCCRRSSHDTTTPSSSVSPPLPPPLYRTQNIDA